MKKLRIIGFMIFIGLLFAATIMFVACFGRNESVVGPCSSHGYCLGYVLAWINEEYYEKFDAKEFTLEDFDWDNASDFLYGCHYPNCNDRLLVLLLIEPGKNHVNEAVAHLNELEFVERAALGYSMAIDFVSELCELEERIEYCEAAMEE